ncbi:MAG: DNA helicase RecQ [Vulcanimicrobiaceae bacterium]
MSVITPEANTPRTPASDPLLDALKHSFGFSTFRPLQREIVAAALRGEDVLALLPTGGGKSLCYQLPALLSCGLTLVVSPLIALMKDQVDALRANGIAATFLNSSLDGGTAFDRLEALERGEYTLLYVAPERLLLQDFLGRLARWNVQRLAVDEAHCVSEWGHDFRPEYRRIARVRERLPNVPITALTATATARVRDDIEQTLGLRAPQRFVGSFDRPNLRYRVVEKRDAFGQLLAFVRERPSESGIVYAATRSAAESLAERLRGAGIAAAPYHAGLGARERVRNQERFIHDDIDIICATIAFGMGIDKSNVRFVVHADLPKSLEGYYQETGRAGRDGLPSDCLLFFSGADAAKIRWFLSQTEDLEERARGEALLRTMLDFAAHPRCRRAFLLRYFGERPQRDACEACDRCLDPPETRDATVAASKLLACVYRVQERGFSTGLHHLVDVLLGNETEKMRDWGHQRLSTFGIGSELSKGEWLALADELLRLDLLALEPQRRTVALTATGRRALRERPAISFCPPAVRVPRAARARRSGRVPMAAPTNVEAQCFERLRALRKRLADEAGVPPYVVFSDATLREIAARRPADLGELRRIGGVGDVKLERYGAAFLAELDDDGQAHPPA